jgi:hypothetical protein
MTTFYIKDIGLCADFSSQGDWAFDYALSTCKFLGYGLNIFYVPDLDWSSARPRRLPSADDAVALDRRVREYYEPRLGDFVDIGFRLCEGFADSELRRCLLHRDYQVLVLGYIETGQRFADRTIEEFANSFNGPVVLVGPREPSQFFINHPARLVCSQLALPAGGWNLVMPAERVPAWR